MKIGRSVRSAPRVSRYSGGGKPTARRSVGGCPTGDVDSTGSRGRSNPPDRQTRGQGAADEDLILNSPNSLGPRLKHLRAAAPPRRETDIQRAILAYLAGCPGVVAWRNNTGAMAIADRFIRFGRPGLPDILGWVEEYAESGLLGIQSTPARDRFYVRAKKIARVLAIEVKRPGQHPTRAQAEFIGAMTRAGGLAIVATSVDDVRQALGR